MLLITLFIINSITFASGEPNGTGSKGALVRVGGGSWRLSDEGWNSKYGYLCEVHKNKLGGDGVIVTG